MKKIQKIMAVLLSVVSGGWGGVCIASCTLEPSVDSPASKPAALIAGMPGELTVYQPRITSDGATTTLTYRVEADFSGWEDGGLPYTAQKAVAEKGAPAPQSIEALILHYGNSKIGLFGTAGVSTISTDNPYRLTNKKDDAALSPYVILPLDTKLVKTELLKKYPAIGGTFGYLVWIEENEAGIALELGSEEGSWASGTYAKGGVRITGLKNGETLSINCTIDNFDDGDPKTEDDPTRPTSIATVLVSGSTSVINFYSGNAASAICENLTGVEPKWSDPSDVTKWMADNAPAVRVVYQWAD